VLLAPVLPPSSTTPAALIPIGSTCHANIRRQRKTAWAATMVHSFVNWDHS
jgi:hypothetical protein